MDSLLLNISSMLSESYQWAFLGCFVWGLVSIFFSPCHLASIPLLMAYVCGQQQVANWKRAGVYALLFSFGLFTSIALIGVICAALGRLMGDIPPIVTLFIGIGIALLGLQTAGLINPRSLNISRDVKLKGYGGALILGAGFGVFSGSCTFGFLAPILASASLQENFLSGLLLVTVFALGHCLPIVLAGSFTSFTCRLLGSCRIQSFAQWGRKAAGAVIFLIGIYFAVSSLFQLQQ